ncbi:P-loop NTPase [Candidatus Sumerlaeota bacterium]|nr:P-loop NTPase [Candidatus Sumerlaeota bacterium]
MDTSETGSLSPQALDHAENPRNIGPIDPHNGHARVTGPCGETMEFWILVERDKVEEASFTTTGCDSSRACGSMATCLAKSKTVEDATRVGHADILSALGGLPPDTEHCALLAANTLKAACRDFLARRDTKMGEERSMKDPDCGSCEKSQCPAFEREKGESDRDFADRRQLHSRLCRVGRKILVMSGKGGVGKSTVAVNLAMALTMAGKRVGLLDVDIHGPSIPTMLGLEGEQVLTHMDELVPVEIGPLKVLSLGFFLRNQDDAVIWRGPMKMGVIKQFLKDADWGDLDFLIIDSPPGTGDEPLSVCQLIGDLDGAVIVTTPQKVAAVDVRKSVMFCKQLRVPVVGVVENMSGFVCPKCGEATQILRSGGGMKIAEDMNVPFLGAIPIDPAIAESGDDGRAFVHSHAESPAARAMRGVVDAVAALDRRTQ